MPQLLTHVRHAVRTLVRTPLFSLTAVASLAIGLGATVAIFAVANALLFAPAAGVADIHRLVDIGRTNDGAGFDTVSYATYADLRDRRGVFAGVFAYGLEPQPMSLGGEAGAERIHGMQVSGGYFDVLGVVPAAGRFFHAAEERVGEPLRQVVLSHPFWARRYERRPTAVGETLILNGDAFAIVGVAPEGFQGTTVLAPDLWVPLTAHARGMATANTLRGRENSWLMLGARVRADVTLAQAQSELDVFMREVQHAHPDVYRERGLRAAPASRLPGVGRAFVLPFMGVLLALVVLVLLVACTNLAGLLLARAADRSREVAVRTALGASRGSIAAMLLAETLAMFAAGAAAGWLVSLAIMRGLATMIAALPVPAAVPVTPDWRVLAFALGLTLITGVLTGLAPALRSARSPAAADLRREAAATPRRQRLRRGFTAAQLACCVVLVVAAGLFVRALAAAARVDPGFDVDGIEVASIDLALGGYPEAGAAIAAEDIRTRLAAIPGVDAVEIAAMVPLSGGGLGLGALRSAGAGPEVRLEADWNVVSPGFLAATSTALVQGRHFTPADREGAPLVAIVNARLAARLWPDRDPVGEILEHGDLRPGRADSIRRLTVVGVARDVKSRWLGDQPRHFVYVPLAQNPMRSLSFFLRHRQPTAGAGLQPAVRQALRGFDPNLPLIHMAPLASFAELGLLPQRIAAALAAALGVVALGLAAIGVYGVTAYAVASRTREIGIRLAIGAAPGRVVREMARAGMRTVAIGVGVGLAGAAAVMPLIASLLFGVPPLDPLTFSAATASLGSIGVLATYLPARRAAAVAPVIALRAE